MACSRSLHNVLHPPSENLLATFCLHFAKTLVKCQTRMSYQCPTTIYIVIARLGSDTPCFSRAGGNGTAGHVRTGFEGEKMAGVSLHEWLDEDSKELLNDEERIKRTKTR